MYSIIASAVKHCDILSKMPYLCISEDNLRHFVDKSEHAFQCRMKILLRDQKISFPISKLPKLIDYCFKT